MKKKIVPLAATIIFTAVVIAGISFLFFTWDWDQIRTLGSLRKVSEHPFYVMHYYGDYGFEIYLQEGVLPNMQPSQTMLPSAESYACTCFAALNPMSDMLFGRNVEFVLPGNAIQYSFELEDKQRRYFIARPLYEVVTFRLMGLPEKKLFRSQVLEIGCNTHAHCRFRFGHKQTVTK